MIVTAEKVGLATSPPYLSLASSKVKNKNVSFLSGVNFASGGAGIFKGIDPNYVSAVLILSFLFFHQLCFCVCKINMGSKMQFCGLFQHGQKGEPLM